MRVTLNIGLEPTTAVAQRNLESQDARCRRALHDALRLFTGPVLVELRTDVPTSLHSMKAEPTLVIEGIYLNGVASLHARLTALAALLDQDAIAYTHEQINHQYRTVETVGRLAGPRAAEWEPFNADLFLTHQGAFK